MIGERSTVGGLLCVTESLLLQVSDCQKTIVLTLRDPAGVVAISQNNFSSCMFSGKYEFFKLDCHDPCGKSGARIWTKKGPK